MYIIVIVNCGVKCFFCLFVFRMDEFVFDLGECCLWDSEVMLSDGAVVVGGEQGQDSSVRDKLEVGVTKRAHHGRCPACGAKDRHLFRHVHGTSGHLPFEVRCKNVPLPQRVGLMSLFLQILCEYLGFVDLIALAMYVGKQPELLPGDTAVTHPLMEEVFGVLCDKCPFRVIGLGEVRIVFHWRVLAVLTTRLSGERQRVLREMTVGNMKATWRSVFKPDQGIVGVDGYGWLGLVTKEFGGVGLEIVERLPEVQREKGLGWELKHIVTGYEGIRSWPTYEQHRMVCEDGRVRVSYGWGPRGAVEFNEGIHIAQIMERVVTPGVVGIGAIGVDFNAPEDEWPVQERVMRAILKATAGCGLPYIVRVDGKVGDHRPHRRCIQVCGEIIPKFSRLLLQGFKGTLEDFTDWLNAFPNVCIGVSPRVVGQEWMEELITRLPLRRVIVESGAPFRDGGMDGHPWVVGSVVGWVAATVHRSVDEVFACSTHCARFVYGI